ncbi:MAG: LacI family transcriptional regulator [Acinetobacter sp.]|nr:MAG: LacI family transcriptional regulator [Acinetobacter sp.]
MKKHQVTIIDIAKELNISKSTVSRALTNNPNINRATKEKILDLAKKLDYQKNMMAISLITNTSNTIGIIVPDFITSYFPNIIIGAQNVASRLGYSVIISQSNESFETEVENANVMLANQVDGILVSVTRETKTFDHLKVFQRKGIPIVFFNRICEEMIVPKVIVDDYEGAFNAVEHLIEIGKKRIAHFAGPKSLSISNKRLNGYNDALIKHNIEIDQDLIIHTDRGLENIPDQLLALLKLEMPCDAIFAFNDPTAVEIIKGLKKLKVRIPEDVAVVGFSNDFVSEIIEPSLTTVSQPVKQIGETAAQLLIDQINRDVKDWKAVTKVLNTTLIVRNSTVSHQ